MSTDKAANQITICLLKKEELKLILPFIAEMNPQRTEEELLVLLEEVKQQAYQCAAIFVNEDIAGICGMWLLTHFHSGRQLELENVIVSKAYRSQQLGRKLMEWVYSYAKSIDCKTIELNTYVRNTRSHKFYYNEGFEILGFHMQKRL